MVGEEVGWDKEIRMNKWKWAKNWGKGGTLSNFLEQHLTFVVGVLGTDVEHLVLKRKYWVGPKRELKCPSL